MEINKITDFFYEKASKRIALEVKKSGLTYSEIYPNDPKQISWIINNKKTKNNRFLICDAVLASYKEDGKEFGLSKKLNFSDSVEVLWGKETEIRQYLPELFVLLWETVTDPTYPNHIIADEYLCDYVPYAKYLSYWNILFSAENRYPALMYGIREDDVINNIDLTRAKAFEYLYIRCSQTFANLFIKFSQDTKSFHKLDKTLNDKLVKKFIKMLSNYKPSDLSSLGLRVQKLIYTDLSMSAPMIAQYQQNNFVDVLKQQLVNASSVYISQLADIQEKMLS